MNRHRFQGLLLGLILSFGVFALRSASAGVEPLGGMNQVTFTAVVSSGTTPIALVAGVAGRVVVPVSVTFRNRDSTVHTVLLRGTTSGTTVYPVEVPAGGSFAWDNIGLTARTGLGDGLSFSIDSGGTTVTVSGMGLQ